MKLGICGALTAVALATTLAAAQDKSRTRVIVEDGKDVTLTGCVQRNPEGGYTLTNAAGKDGTVGSYILALLDDDDNDELDDLKDHVGHRVEIKGKAADRGDGRIRVKTDSGKTESKSEVKGDLSGLPFLGVKSSRMIASVCP
ncbi:MAG TPA: hypothetical protein VFJ02_10575 [Vicinamibacterales bacterium]|nr:hypothetical protein [Vicinamibacterales bacterium]